MANSIKGGLACKKVSAEYFQQRGLKRYAGPWSLWALGVGAVISGDFLGWYFDLRAGGFGGLFVAGLVYFAAYARHRMVLSPEEGFAVEHAQTARPTNNSDGSPPTRAGSID